jgi:hypothetical protein
MAQKNRKQVINFIFGNAECYLLRAEGFSYSLDVLSGGLVISKLQFWIRKRKEKNFNCIFFQFLVIKTLDPYPGPESDPYPDPDSLEMLDPDPYPDPDPHTGFLYLKIGRIAPF